jgi:hypothetical protein
VAISEAFLATHINQMSSPAISPLSYGTAQLPPRSLLQLELASLQRQIYQQPIRAYLSKLEDPDSESRSIAVAHGWSLIGICNALRALELLVPFVSYSIENRFSSTFPASRITNLRLTFAFYTTVGDWVNYSSNSFDDKTQK